MTRPDTTYRDKLLRALINRGISNTELSKIVQTMRGKAQEEKEIIALQMRSEEATVEMLKYCANNPNAIPARLLKESSEIALKYRTWEDQAEEYTFGR